MEASLVVLSIAVIFAGAFVAPALFRMWGDRAATVLGCLPLAGFLFYVTLIQPVGAGQFPAVVWEWVPALGINLAFRIDGLALMFLLIISLIGAFVVWYAGGYLHGDPNLGRFLMTLLGFMGAMLGMVVSDNIFLLFVFWELTSITSYLLIGYYNEKEDSRRSALQALLVTGGGGLALLAGLILLALIAGTPMISGLLSVPPAEIVADPAFPAALILILLGAFTKSAQFPFHFWLPNAMAAPAPVSSFLHSATMVKAGVFLLARLHPCLSESPLWLQIVAPVGAATMLIGVFLGLGQTDMKKILAYTTLAVLGTLTMLLGLGTDLAVKAAMTYLLAHALYKAALFMAAGSVDHETGCRNVDELGGLRTKMPWTTAAAVLAGLSMAGLPFLIGFVSKEYFYKALLDVPGPPGLWETFGVAASVAMAALAGTVVIRPFFGKLRETPKAPHEAPWSMRVGPLVLGAIAIKMGVIPGTTGDNLIAPATRAVLWDHAYHVELKLWHGLTLPLALSALTIILGFLLYKLAPRIRRAQGLYTLLRKVGPEAGYHASLAGLLSGASSLTRVIQSGFLRNYVLIVGIFFVLLVGWQLPRNTFLIDWSLMVPPDLMGIAACVAACVGGVACCVVKSRFTAILCLGVVGLAVAILYFLFSAPDLAMTQILVETLALVLFVLAFHKLPLLKDYSKLAIRGRDAVFATIFGVVMTLLVLIALHFEVERPPISEYMGEQSYPLAHGRNVVNVILVDFRALDTLGEIGVLAIAALGVYAMLKLRMKGGPK